MSEHDDSAPVGRIFAALSAVKDEINDKGIPKSQRNEKQRYDYRGIDDAMDGFSGPLARAKVLAVPSYKPYYSGHIETNAGGALQHIVLELFINFLSLEDGSHITAGPFYGEASDVLDKAYSKAQSVAYRNALFLTFNVPLGPEVDPEHSDNGAEAVVGDTGVEPVPAAASNDGPREIDVTASQGKVLDVKLGQAGKDRDWLLQSFGGVHKGNINDAIKHIERAKS